MKLRGADMQGKKYKSKDGVFPVLNFTPEDIKRIRKKTGASQGFLANWLGVSKKTVQAWESGRNIPNGSAARLLMLLDENVIDIDIFLKKG
jgi:putative transcriptional regulator